MEYRLNAEHHHDFAGTMIEQGSESGLQRARHKGLNGNSRTLEKKLAGRTPDFSE